jgi:hypothetical protein
VRGTVNDWSGWTPSLRPEWYSVAAQTGSGGRIELLGLRKAAQDAWHRSQALTNCACWTGWSSFDRPLNSGAVALDKAGRVEAFGTDSQGHTWHRAETERGGARSFRPWERFDNGLPTAARALAAEINADNLVEVFAVTRAGQIWHRWETAASSGTYTPWVQLDGLLKSVAVARNKSGLLELFGTNQAGQAFHRSAVVGTNAWLPWTQFDQPAAVGPLHSVACDTNGDGRVEVFSVNGAGQVWHRWQTAADGLTYSPWIQLDGTLRP